MIKASTCVSLGIGFAVLVFAISDREPVAEQGAVTREGRLRIAYERMELTSRARLEVPKTRAPIELDTETPRKYALLLEPLDPDTRDQLLQILVAREASSDFDVTEAARWERQISILLREDDYSLYEQLRESANEQAQLQAFEQQLSDSAPLTRQQQHDLLRAKLNYKHQTEALEIRAHTRRPDLSAMEDGYARDIAVQGVSHHARAFLDEARAVLSDEQWLALEQFEMAALEQRMHPLETAHLSQSDAQ